MGAMVRAIKPKAAAPAPAPEPKVEPQPVDDTEARRRAAGVRARRSGRRALLSPGRLGAGGGDEQTTLGVG